MKIINIEQTLFESTLFVLIFRLSKLKKYGNSQNLGFITESQSAQNLVPQCDGRIYINLQTYG